jgi:hypothetical protein
MEMEMFFRFLTLVLAGVVLLALVAGVLAVSTIYSAVTAGG